MKLRLSPDQLQVMNYLGYSMIDMDINLKKVLSLLKRPWNSPHKMAQLLIQGWAYFR